MRYELSDYEWTAIKPMLPNKPRGVRRVNDRRVLNGIFWVLRLTIWRSSNSHQSEFGCVLMSPRPRPLGIKTGPRPEPQGQGRRTR